VCLFCSSQFAGGNHRTNCLDCPVGGYCDTGGGNISALRSFWGTVVEEEVIFTQCPDGQLLFLPLFLFPLICPFRFLL
jgi:hypothetical protein